MGIMKKQQKISFVDAFLYFGYTLDLLALIYIVIVLTTTTTLHKLSANPIENEPVTFSTVQQFLEEDDTNLHKYYFLYDCKNFSIDLVQSAKRHNIPAKVVVIGFDTQDIGHTIVGFITSDAGIVYVEPQSDDIYVLLEMGKQLCTTNGACWNGVISRIGFEE